MTEVSSSTLEPREHVLSGLTSAEVKTRKTAGQTNSVAWRTSRSFKRIVLENAATPINVALFSISAVLLGLQLFGDALLTGGLVLGNVVMGVFQETRAKRQLDRIALLNRPHAVVIRDSVEVAVPPDEIVLGDYVILLPGEQVFADGKLVSASGLGMDESLLTGESDVLAKSAGDQVVSGTYALTGSGVYETTRVGADTTANEITATARQSRVPRTPLQREVGFVLWIMTAVVVLLGISVARSFQASGGDVAFEDTVRAAAVIVALVPQGLAVMVTVSYAMAAFRMAGTGVLIQHMNAVESISHVDVLCIDKTGTLTTNRLAVECLRPYNASEADLQGFLGAFTASASFRNRTADAIQASFERPAREFTEEIPFDSVRKWSGLIFDDDDMRGAFVLGAPDIMQPQLTDDETLEADVKEWSERGLRVLLLASNERTHSFPHSEVPLLPPDLSPLGLVVLRDETRPDAASVISEFAESGISLKVISGDHPETVAALATQAGLPVQGEPIQGVDLESMDDAELMAAVQGASVFGRVSPQSKEKIVRALKRSGRYVAMVGDGVNDVPALKAAHVAVGLRSGSGITRDIADMVLLNDAFSNLPRAFREGQRIRKGMESIFRVFLTRTLSLTLVILAISLLNDPFPVTPKHTSLIALMTVGIPTLFIAIWAKPGRTGRLVIPSGVYFVIPASLGIAAVGLVVYEFFLPASGDVDLAQTALTITATGCGLLIILFLEPPTEGWVGATPLSGDWRPAALTAGLFGLFAASMAVPTARDFYELTLPDVWGFFMIALVIIAWAYSIRAVWRANLPARIRDRFRHFGRRRAAVSIPPPSKPEQT